MQPTYHIRLARPSDLPLVPEIERQAGSLYLQIGWDPALLVDVTDADSLADAQQAGRLWIAADEVDQPVGFALVALVDDHAHLDELAVHPDHGRRGLGRALIEQVCAWAYAAGYPAVTLTTERDVPWNAPFYARLGFVVLEPDAWSADLCRIVDEEDREGWTRDSRVVMIRHKST